jgi:methylglutaconyl-CoA hydratase
VINAARKCPKFIIGRVQGKAVGGGVGMASATDYCFATKFASVKLSELAIGIGPFVVGPAVERKIGTSAFSAMTINAGKWFDAAWAREKGLYTEVFDSAEQMDTEIEKLASTLSKSNPEAMEGLKKIMWEGTEHWDTLLMERAESSGKLVLSDFTKDAITKFKQQ